MKVVGIIAEYNPFHNGHAYQIDTIKRNAQADYVIAAMSGNFVQRGAPALLDKYARADMALRCGVDLVLELPVLFACASAEAFARGGVSLLCDTGVVTHLGFGMETSHFALLSQIADVLLRQPSDFQNTLRMELKQGLSFPAARAKALETYFSCDGAAYDAQPLLQETLAAPNNILAVEYLKALKSLGSGIIPSPLQRKGSGYHDPSLDRRLSSATGIRAFVTSCKDRAFQPLENAMPAASLGILTGYPYPFLAENDFSILAHYKLLTESLECLSSYADSSRALASRMKKHARQFTTWHGFCEQLKTKNITYTHLSRLLLHMTLGIKAQDCKDFPKPLYLRVLGFSKKAAPLLSAIKAKGTLPLLTSPAKSSSLLPSAAQRMLAFDLDASSLYALGQNGKGCRHIPNDYQIPIVIRTG